MNQPDSAKLQWQPGLARSMRTPMARAAFVLLAIWLAVVPYGCHLQVRSENRGLPFQPAVVSFVTEPEPLRVVVLGDFGWGGDGQSKIADAIAGIHAIDPLDFGITVGDNFYQHGVSSVQDEKWLERWERPYGSIGIPFYPALGNHDYYGSVQAQLDYVSPSGTWHLPARQYRLHAGIAEFFAIDTMDENPQQWLWLSEAITESPAQWKVVYGHHPVYSAGNHGDGEQMQQDLLPVIRGKADIYIAGHDHDMEHLKPLDGTHFLVSGGGGAKLHRVRRHPRLLFGKAAYGFTVLTFLSDRIVVEMFGEGAEQLYRTEIRKESAPAAVLVPNSGANGFATVLGEPTGTQPVLR